MRFLRGIVLVIVAATLPAHVLSAQWSLGSAHAELRGKTIVDVGSVEPRNSLASSRLVYDYRLRRYVYRSVPYQQWIRFEGRATFCFEASQISPSERSAAVLLSDGDNRFYIAVISSRVGSIWVAVSAATPIACPSEP